MTDPARLTVGDLAAAEIGQTVRVADGRRGQLSSVRHYLVNEQPRTSLIISAPPPRPGERPGPPWREIPLPSDTTCSLRS